MNKDRWFRVEVSDHEGQIVAIESEMLAGRDIGDSERETICTAIDCLSGFLGLPHRDAIAAHPSAQDKAEAGRVTVPCCGYQVVVGGERPYPVQWNPFNGVVQCHNCGTTWQPEVRRISVRDVFEDKT